MATWVPESQRTLKWTIWHKPFYASVPNIQTRSPDHIRAFGTPTSGDKARDRAAAEERLETTLTIRDMVVYHSQGIVVGLLRRADTKIVYDILMEYLNTWKSYITSSLLTRVEAPYDDLVAMERFLASALFPHAVKYKEKNVVAESWLSKRIGELGNQGITLKFDAPPTAIGSDPLLPGEAPIQPAETAAARLFSNRRNRWRQ